MRPLKTKEEFIQEGYNAEAAVVFLHDFIEDEKIRQLRLLMTCPADELKERRAVVKYIDTLEPYLLEKVRTAIIKATEHVETHTRQED